MNMGSFSSHFPALSTDDVLVIIEIPLGSVISIVIDEFGFPLPLISKVSP